MHKLLDGIYEIIVFELYFFSAVLHTSQNWLDLQ